MPRLEYTLEHWTAYQHQFKAEFLIGIFYSISSLILLVLQRRAEFALICIGQLLYASAFPTVLGIYPEAPGELSVAISLAAHGFVTVGLMLSMLGFLILHWNLRILPRWVHITAFIIASVAFSTYTLAFLGLLEPVAAQRVMFLVTFLYLINGIYAIRMKETTD